MDFFLLLRSSFPYSKLFKNCLDTLIVFDLEARDAAIAPSGHVQVELTPSAGNEPGVLLGISGK